MSKDFGVVIDDKRLQQIMKAFPNVADKVIGKIALDAQGYIVEHFSSVSPSAPGEPPGIVTGYLKNSMQTKRLKPLQWSVETHAAYAPPLEYGTVKMAARPFFRPAVLWTGKRLGKLFNEHLKDEGLFK